MTRSENLPQFVRDLLSSPPHRGGGLNNWFYRVARVLHPFRGANEIIELLKAATADEPVKHGEIERAVERSKATAWQPGQSAATTQIISPWPKVNKEKRAAIARTGGGLCDLWECSPVRLEDNKSHTEEIIDRLFPNWSTLLCAGRSNQDFKTRSRMEWRGELSKLALIVPNPMVARSGKTQDGRESAHALSITGPRRFLVIEQDQGTEDEQAAVLLHLAQIGPMAVAVHSGSKSIHGWFYCVGRPEEKLRKFMEYAVSLGADPATWTRSQFVRMPDGTRENGNRQVVYFFHPETIK